MRIPRTHRLGRVTIGLAWTGALGAVVAPVLPAQEPPPPSLQSHLDPARLRSVRDSFVVVLQGRPSGWQRLTATSQGGQWLLGDAITIDGMVHQESAVVLDAAFHEVSLRQEGEARQVPMRIALDFAGGRVTGSALTPAGGASGAVAIDTTVDATTLDDNAILPLLVGVRWRDSLEVSFPVLTSGKGQTAHWSVRVLGRDTTTVPAGRFDTWRVEMQTGGSRSIVHVTREAPYRIVRLQNGPAFDIQLVNDRPR